MKSLKSKLKTLSCVLAVVLCMTAFSVTAFAADGGYYASNENTTEAPPDSIDSIVVGTENVQLPEGGGTGTGDALTPDGNLTLIDDILQAGAFVSEENERAEKLCCLLLRRWMRSSMSLSKSSATTWM